VPQGLKNPLGFSPGLRKIKALIELLDAPTDLIRVIFPNMAPDDKIEIFTSFCGFCGGVQGIEERSAR
jgi:hypothetical protein